MSEGKHTEWRCEKAIDHNVRPHRLRWLVFTVKPESIVTILDNQSIAGDIVRDHNSYEQDQETIKALVDALDGMMQHVAAAKTALALAKKKG